MKKQTLPLIWVMLGLIFLIGCEAFNPEPTHTPAPPPVEPTAAQPTRVTSPTPTPEGPITIRLWVPPEFEPSAETRAGRLLQARLDEFSSRRPNASIETRVKSLEGIGGLLDSLTTANAAAPLALPDLVALPRPLLETAALKGLLVPYDDLSDALDDADWYEYARDLGQLQNSTFGLPFAGDAMVLTYRPEVIGSPPTVLTQTITQTATLAFAAADPLALFTLTLYEAAGGPTLDQEGRPILDPDVLSPVLSFYQEAAQAEVFPFWLTQYETDQEVWTAYSEGQADMAITWIHQYLDAMLADSSAALLPTLDGEPYTRATGWVWALVSPDPGHRRLSVELAEYLTESSFLSAWTAAAAYLPPRPSALAAWQSSSLQGLADEVEASAHIYPSADILNSLAPLLQEATIEVLKNQIDPLDAAEQAAESLSAP